MGTWPRGTRCSSSASYGSLQDVQTLRARRWATTSTSEEATRNGGTPMSMSRATVDGESLVCRVENTRCPVSAARIEICAVSRSRVSPTRITSGSWRRNARSAEAEGQPALGDVKVRHDLEPRDDRGLEPLGRCQQLVQDAVDAEPDAKRLLVGLPVDVARALLDGVDQHHVDQLHDGRLVGRLLQLEH